MAKQTSDCFETANILGSAVRAGKSGRDQHRIAICLA